MASHQRSASTATTATATAAAGRSRSSAREKSYFEQQREELIGEIALSFEHVLANINKLNRSLEAVIAVGNEFSSVEALWSTFETVMAKDPEAGAEDAAAAAGSKPDDTEGETEVDEDQSRNDESAAKS
ncbi:DASH complex subunit Dad1-domain-containing protein [Lasiosphaeria ovina]|uniref:DASH complex subunit DAD1 n=1 Tax=Lasiosphaeria ovina TaxID=92902 RepID=A0AAE0K8C7_9PEZI|nr:DASH complex subunit Dad1-domain-containing protein [Lasiosphaeria ovina]